MRRIQAQRTALAQVYALRNPWTSHKSLKFQTTQQVLFRPWATVTITAHSWRVIIMSTIVTMRWKPSTWHPCQRHRGTSKIQLGTAPWWKAIGWIVIWQIAYGTWMNCGSFGSYKRGHLGSFNWDNPQTDVHVPCLWHRLDNQAILLSYDP